MEMLVEECLCVLRVMVVEGVDVRVQGVDAAG
jgi:hypothetical protein